MERLFEFLIESSQLNVELINVWKRFMNSCTCKALLMECKPIDTFLYFKKMAPQNQSTHCHYTLMNCINYKQAGFSWCCTASNGSTEMKSYTHLGKLCKAFIMLHVTKYILRWQTPRKILSTIKLNRRKVTPYEFDVGIRC